MTFQLKLTLSAVVLLRVLDSQVVESAPFVINTNLQIRLVMNTKDGVPAYSIRVAKDPRNHQLYYAKMNGFIYRLNSLPDTGVASSAIIYNSTDHGISEGAQGMTIGPDGTIYFVANAPTSDGNSTVARIMKGVPNANGTRTWKLLAKTDPYPRSKTAFDHVFNGVVVSPDGNHIYVNSGSRTDHGEVQSGGGAFPGTREVPLTAKILRLPASGLDLVLPNDANALRNAGYIFCEGIRNAFDMAFAPNGDLFGTENGPDRDMSEELNWLRPGLHYGFPWRIGGTDNPQQFRNYDPSRDRLLDHRFLAYLAGYYHDDPTFPPPPANLTEPVINAGPDADSYRDATDGSIKDASEQGRKVSTFTAHRSPLGLVFDTAGAMAPPFQHHAFVLSWTAGDASGASVPGPFKDASEDLLDVDLTRLGDTNYQARITRLVGGFLNPIDAEIIGNRIYVLEYGGNQGLWEVSFPPNPSQPAAVEILSPAIRGNDFSFAFATEAGQRYEVQFAASLNPTAWNTFTNFTGNGAMLIVSGPVTGMQRFYRVSAK
ncbi:MAG: PQQ-dependent sugar dehydrogenase [Verrucomicrobia bacterium]|nr:PQQ-dependent sugar dehydrogenase [Verrucomicrobiota bacterium]